MLCSIVSYYYILSTFKSIFTIIVRIIRNQATAEHTKIESIIDIAIENTPNRNEAKILAKTERKIKKLGLRLSREKLRVMIVNQIEDARMLDEARKEEEEKAQAEKLKK